MSERYAIYYAPATTDSLWQKASHWLGRDCHQNCELAQPSIEGITPVDQYEYTASPRRYGFHATIKAPFQLAANTNIDAMRRELKAFARVQKPVEIGKLKLHQIGKFIALVPADQSEDVTRFAQKVVRHFDRYRAPMSAEKRQERIAAGLNDRQIELLDQWGYPYVSEQFKMHLTLTGQVEEQAGKMLFEAAQHWFADETARTFQLDNLALYHEPEKGAPFVRLEDFPLKG